MARVIAHHRLPQRLRTGAVGEPETLRQRHGVLRPFVAEALGFGLRRAHQEMPGLDVAQTLNDGLRAVRRGALTNGHEHVGVKPESVTADFVRPLGALDTADEVAVMASDQRQRACRASEGLGRRNPLHAGGRVEQAHRLTVGIADLQPLDLQRRAEPRMAGSGRALGTPQHQPLVADAELAVDFR
jgi:hypothetical protein